MWEVVSWPDQERLHNDDDNLSLEDVILPRSVSCEVEDVHIINFPFNIVDTVHLSDKTC